MKRFRVRFLNCILTAALVLGLCVCPSMPVYADRSMSEVQESIDQYEAIVDGLGDQIDTLTDEQDIILEQMDDLNAEIINMLTSIAMLQDEIAQKEEDIADKQTDIDKTQQEYEEAKKTEENQQAAMKTQIRMSYEGGKSTWFSLILNSTSFSDLLNRMTYAEEVLAYNDTMLEKYEDAKEQVHKLWGKLEAEKTELEKQKADLEDQKADLEDQKVYCDNLMAEMKKQSDNFDTLIAEAKAEAAAAKKKLQAEKKELEKLKEEERKRQEALKLQEALNKTYATTDYTKIIDATSGSDLGKKIAKYGCQYIGNKYVYGGTNLTKGIDCSGFTMRVYEAFGYKLPRTSYAQRSAGKSVDFKDAQPGDLICYSGHIGIYIGDGYIVHASNSKPYPRGGIKVNKATYRKILSVRRIIE